jgi:diguanylate cyclase (GGDEF)-like protein
MQLGMENINGRDYLLASFYASPAPSLILDHNLTIRYCNAAYQRLTYVTEAEMAGRYIFDVFTGSHDEQARIVKDSFDLVLSTRKPHTISHLQFATAVPGFIDLQERIWTVSNHPLLLEDGTLFGILNCTADITELSQLRQASELVQKKELNAESQSQINDWTRSVQDILRFERQRLQSLFQQAPSFICVLRGPSHVFEIANDAYYQLVGHRDIIGRGVADIMPEVVAQGFVKKLDAVYATGEPFIGRAIPIALQRIPEGPMEQLYIDLIYQPILDDAGAVTGIFTQGNDVTEAHLLSEEMGFQAAHDFLTGLYNRREFRRRTLNSGGPGSHALLYMDIDHLKIVNDRCGHAAGDSLLVQIATALAAECSDHNDLLARLGGDEFALVRHDCSQEDAISLAERLRSAVKDIQFVWQRQRYEVTLSIGVVNFGVTEQLSFEQALGLADAACFLAKEKGRNRVQIGLISDEEVQQQQYDMDNVTRLKDAMRDDRVILYSQKIISLQPNRSQPCAFQEVLARLRDPNGAVVAPAGFIPAAERFGLIEELDRHIVCKLFAHLEGCLTSERDEICYFVNLSGLTLSSPGFVDFIGTALATYPLVRPSEICFEITETAALSDVSRTAIAMRSLTSMGFMFALDDFGSGMASFSYLSKLPVHFVKIDGDFVKGILEEPAGGTIVEAVAKVARAMGIRTIAESVEFDELIPPLEAIGIDYLQGYALHRPVPIAECLLNATAWTPSLTTTPPKA